MATHWTIHHQGISGALGIGNKAISTMLLGTITGGAGAALAKGNFWQGAVTGLIVSGLNHAAHSAFDDPPVKKGSFMSESYTDADNGNQYLWDQEAGKWELATFNLPEFTVTPGSNFSSGSSIVGYQGMILNKTEVLITLSSKGQSFSNLRHTATTLKMTSAFGKGLGLAGIGLSVYEDFNSHQGLSWGTAAKIGIGGLLLFASAPVSLGYAVLDLGVGIATGTTITDRAANYINNQTR